MNEWAAIFLTFKLAFITTLVLLFLGVPLAYWLSQTQSRVKPVIEALVSMPLVLPPTVLGFYLLLVFSPNYPFGNFLDRVFHVRLVFSFEGLVVASTIYSLPFMVQPLQSGLSNLPRHLSEASYLLGKSKWTTLFRVLLPNMKASVLTGIVLSFAHTIGEFGVVLMIGGSIPNETKVASIAIYEQVEAMNYQNAHAYSLFLFIVTFIILLIVYLINEDYHKRFGL